jgi:hypothetical protein
LFSLQSALRPFHLIATFSMPKIQKKSIGRVAVEGAIETVHFYPIGVAKIK